MQKILITEGTSSLAFKVKNLLASKFEVVLGSSGEIPSVLMNNYLVLPKSSSSSYSHEILKLAMDNKIEFILPLETKELVLLSQSLVLFEEYGIKLLIPKPAALSSIQIVNTVPNSLDIVLLQEGTDLISGDQMDLLVSGLGIMSDSGYDFILLVSR